jgi:hypothetical protein
MKYQRTKYERIKHHVNSTRLTGDRYSYPAACGNYAHDNSGYLACVYDANNGYISGSANQRAKTNRTELEPAFRKKDEPNRTRTRKSRFDWLSGANDNFISTKI